jgi:Transcription activator MBF2
MKSFVILAVFFLFGAQAAKSQQLKTAEVKVVVVKSIQEYLQANPNVTLTEMKINRQARVNQNWYTLGARINGDRLVAIDNGWAQYPSKQNLEFKLWYPASGVGAVLTYIQILITQDNGTFGRGYVTSGGVGQRYVNVVVEAWNTAYFRYDYSLFGY